MDAATACRFVTDQGILTFFGSYYLQMSLFLLKLRTLKVADRGWQRWLATVVGNRGWQPWLATVVGNRRWQPWLATRDGILDVSPASECFERNDITKTDS